MKRSVLIVALKTDFLDVILLLEHFTKGQQRGLLLTVVGGKL